MLERLTDKQIETSIKTIIVLIVIAVLAVGANYVYQKYSSTDVKATDIIDKALSKVKSQPRNERARTELADLLVGQSRLEVFLDQAGGILRFYITQRSFFCRFQIILVTFCALIFL